MRKRGTFIVFEGVEGSGKTTQANRLCQKLRERGVRFVLTKEPGGTPLGDRIRAILLDPLEEGMDGLSELMLYAASRRQHVVEVIRPSLDRQVPVLCDRFTDSTLAYQGFGRTIELDRLRDLNTWVTDGLEPDLTVVFDLPEDIGIRRARERNVSDDLLSESRLEAEDLAFHRRVREGYLALAEESPERYAVVDASGSIEEVSERLETLLRERAPELLEEE